MAKLWSMVGLFWAGVWLHAAPAPVILVSFDGFRWDYVNAVYTPHLDKLFEQGFRVRSMTPSFPSLTFPNHYTLVTGRHPVRHGIVGNQFFDSGLNQSYSMYRSEDVVSPKWYASPAIWEVAKANQLSSAVFFWVGSELEGRQPDIFIPYNRTTSPEEKITRLLKWSDPNQSPTPNIMLAYFSFLDRQGHRFGPDSPEVVYAVQQLDSLIGTLMAGIAAHPSGVNLIVVSDHGMVPLKRVAMSVEKVEAAVGGGDLLHLANNYSQIDLFLKRPTEAKIASVLGRLPQGEGVTWYTREAVPFPTHPLRNGQIMGIAELGFEFKSANARQYRGGHGYNPVSPEMGAACFGFGPGFNAGSEIDRVAAVDVFSLLCHLLEISVAESDGSLNVWAPVLRNSELKRKVNR